MTLTVEPPTALREIVDDVRRRDFLGILAAAGLLAGCGGGESSPGRDDGAGTRSFVDDAGREIEVPAVPRRIVAFNEFAAGEAVLALGGTLVGLTDQGDGEFNPPMAEAYDLSAVTTIGAYGRENAETITSLVPDLVIGETYGEQYNHGVEVDLLQRIAPTVLIDPTRGRAHVLERIAELMGAEDELERQRAAYLLRAREIGESLPDGLSAVVFTGVYGGNLTLYSTRSQNPLPAALVDMGVTAPALADSTPTTGADYIDVSVETILDGDLQADVIVSEDRGDIPQADSPLWGRIPAVRAGQTHITQTPAGTSYLHGMDILDYLEPLLRDADPAVVDEPDA